LGRPSPNAWPTKGIAAALLTPEDISAQLDTVLDVTDGTVIDPE
jgi:hypothetical protein